MNETTATAGRSVGRVTTTTSSSLTLALSFPSLLRPAALRYSNATATAADSSAALPLTSAPLCLMALARVKWYALVCPSSPLVPRNYQPIRTARGK